MGVTMAVKLILVSLVVLSISLAWAQQSEETGGSDRRISLRRFSSRKKVENTRNGGRVKASADILEKRKQLFQRNPSRSRNIGRSKNKQTESAGRQRNVSVKTTTTTEAYLDVEHPVEKISNNDKEIIDFLLDNDKLEDEADTPFRGLSEVRTVSSPSGLRSSNEQIVRVSFKKTTTARPEILDSGLNVDFQDEQINQIQEQEVTTTQKPRRNPIVKVTPRRRLGVRRRGQKPASNARRVSVAPVTKTRFSAQGASDPLKALLKTASEPVRQTESTQPIDNNNDIPIGLEAAMREMKEDNRIEKPKSRSRGNSPRRLSGSSRKNIRINLRGRNGQRNPTQRVGARKESNPNFRSFPARQGGNTGTARRTVAQTTTARPAPRQRFETRPTVSPTQNNFAATEFFKDFDFTPSVNQATNQFNLVTEAPRSAFQLEQNFRGNTEQEQELQVQRQQIIINPAPPQPIQQNIQTPERLQPTAPLQTQPTHQAPQKQENI